MNPERRPAVFRPPTETEREFLRIVVRGIPEFERQIETCDIAEYDVTGWCDVRVAVEPRTIVARPLHGPFFDLSALGGCGFEVVATHGLVMFRSGERTELPPAAAPRVYAVDTLLWAGSDGRLETIEVVCHGDGDLVDPYSAFVWAATLYPPVLRYPPTA